jgi:hypothetical protein
MMHHFITILLDLLTGVKHHSTPSCSQEVNSGSLHVSSSQLQGMGALQQDPQSERCKPTVEITIVEYGCAQPPHVVDDHGGMYPCTLNGKSSPRKAPIVRSLLSSLGRMALLCLLHYDEKYNAKSINTWRYSTGILLVKK